MSFFISKPQIRYLFFVLFTYFCIESLCTSAKASESYSIIHNKPTATFACRFPDMFFNWSELANSSFNVENILVLGPGVNLQRRSEKEPQEYCSPQIHELMGLFPNSRVTAIDKDKTVFNILETRKSNYTLIKEIVIRYIIHSGNFANQNGYINRVLKNENPTSYLLKLTENTPNLIKNNLFEVIHSDFHSFEYPPDSYDIIVATNSLFFVLIDTVSSPKEKEKVSKLFSSIFLSTRKGGFLYIDRASFNHWKSTYEVKIQEGLFSIGSSKYKAARLRNSSTYRSRAYYSNTYDLHAANNSFVVSSDDILRIERIN